MLSHSLTSDKQAWYTHRWPWLLMLGPFLVIVAGSYASWLAFSRQDALVVDDYYKQGKAINQDLRRDHAAASLGLAATLTYDPASSRLKGSLLSFGVPMPGTHQLTLVHATLPEKDISFTIQTDNTGAFSIALPMLEKTRWQVQMESEHREWRLHGTWTWPSQTQLAIKADLP